MGAHLTLFHRLDPDHQGRIEELLESTAARRLPLLVRIEAPKSLGGGVAFGIDSHDLLELRRHLAEALPGPLSPQDEAWNWPHLTVQNKVSGTQARALLRRLGNEPQPEAAMIIGLGLWRYRGGPWDAVARFGTGTAQDPARSADPD